MHCTPVTMMAAKNPKRKCRRYSEEYLKLGFVPSLTNETFPMCLVCEKVFSNDAMKPSKMKDHLVRVHPDKTDKDIDFFRALKDKLEIRTGVVSLIPQPAQPDNEKGLRASYNISLIIAKSGQPYSTAEEIIVPSIKEVIDNLMNKDSSSVLKCLSLSSNAVRQCIDEMAADVEKSLISELQSSRFSIQLDQSTFRDENILMVYVRYFSQLQKTIIDEFLFAKHIVADVKVETIFRCLEEHLQKHNIPLKNITVVSTDGTLPMSSHHRGLTTLLKERIPDVRTIHLMLHRQHLVAKELSEELHDALRVCISAINKIKDNPFNSGLISMLYERNDETMNYLLLHTDTRWLSRGNILQRLVELYEMTVNFLTSTDPDLSHQLQKCKNHLYYLADLFSHLNDVQMRLQGRDVTIIQARTILLGFQIKLGLFKSSLARRNFQYCPNLQELETGGETLSDDDLTIYMTHLEKLYEDFNSRFEDLEKIEIPDWIVAPFDILNGNPFDYDLQEEVIHMFVDLEAKSLFKNNSTGLFWTNVNIINKYPKLSGKVLPFLLSFPSSYITEAGFIHLSTLMTRERNEVNLEKCGELRLKLTSLTTNINTILKHHQANPSY
ncbi:zinc finger BED domain-containing protein 5-like [Macrobrachium nipponense]|uniref:zinc finger BED domain-containing protein 5-like n=1 Tax=Macrobrachium nipponense TaxID=159736 RepID=UPI0030C85F15